MTEQAASTVWLLLSAYMIVGFLGALAIFGVGLQRLGLDAAAVPLRVKVLITPGLTLLWPLVLVRLFGQRAKEDRG